MAKAKLSEPIPLARAPGQPKSPERKDYHARQMAYHLTEQQAVRLVHLIRANADAYRAHEIALRAQTTARTTAVAETTSCVAAEKSRRVTQRNISSRILSGQLGGRSR